MAKWLSISATVAKGFGSIMAKLSSLKVIGWLTLLIVGTRK
jgi:hypothetical protein